MFALSASKRCAAKIGAFHEGVFVAASLGRLGFVSFRLPLGFLVRPLLPGSVVRRSAYPHTHTLRDACSVLVSLTGGGESLFHALFSAHARLSDPYCHATESRRVFP